MLDGARNALLGYLYQLIGTASIRVREVATGDDAWARLSASAEGALNCEEFGQDATARSSGPPLGGAKPLQEGVAAIQFKHSASTGNRLERSELLDILVGFDRSRTEASVEGVTIDQYFLVTNRQLAAGAQELIDHAKNELQPHPALVLQTSTRGGKPIAENLKRLEPHNGDATAAAAAWNSVLKHLDVPAGAVFDGDLKRLRTFAARYGVLEHEWDQRLNALVGAFVSETAAGRSINVTREWLKEHLVGDPGAANLDLGSRFEPHICSIGRERLDDSLRHQHRVPDGCYLERKVHQDLQAALIENSVVFVAGRGGCGKSLSVTRYLQAVSHRQLVWSTSARDATEAAIVDAIVAARLPQRRLGGVDRSLRDIRCRLDVANPRRNERPIWTIDLDGLDEAPDRRPELMLLIGVCWAHGNLADSPASLVVTCRSSTGDRTRAQLIQEWLNAPEADLAPSVGFVSVDGFSDQELVEAAELLRGQPEQRILRSLSEEAAAVLLTQTGLNGPVPDHVIETLKHPVVWGSYASLSPAERNGVLDQDTAHLRELARRLYDRFLGRCCMRRRWRDERKLEWALPAVARAADGPPPFSQDTWDRACQSCIDQTEARELYNESLSYGIIERDASRSWRWGHPFLVDFLGTLTEGTPDER